MTSYACVWWSIFNIWEVNNVLIRKSMPRSNCFLKAWKNIINWFEANNKFDNILEELMILTIESVNSIDSIYQ